MVSWYNIHVAHCTIVMIIWYWKSVGLRPSRPSCRSSSWSYRRTFSHQHQHRSKVFFRISSSSPDHLHTCPPAQGWRGLLSRCGRPAGRGGEADSDGPRVGPSYHRATDVRWTGGGVTDKVCLWDIVHFVSSSRLVCILLYRGAIWS